MENSLNYFKNNLNDRLGVLSENQSTGFPPFSVFKLKVKRCRGANTRERDNNSHIHVMIMLFFQISMHGNYDTVSCMSIFFRHINKKKVIDFPHCAKENMPEPFPSVNSIYFAV